MIRTRILGIAPYEGMRSLMEQLAADMPEVELTAFVGDLEPGAAIAEKYGADDFDVILSRGGTAELIRKKTRLPVIDIELSVYDILRSIRLAETSNNSYAIVGFPAITRNATFLCNVLRYNVDLHTIHDEAEARTTLEQLAISGCPMVLCDMITNSLAREYGLPALLISSGSESIEAALRQAVSISGVFRPIKEHARLLAAILSSRDGDTVAFSESGEEVYRHVLRPLPDAVEHRLQTLCPQIFRESSRRAAMNVEGRLYTITGQLITSGDRRCAAMCIQSGSAQTSLEKNGIRYLDKEEAFDSFFNSFYGITHPETAQLYERYAQSDAPLMIAGELGTGKDQMVRAIYARGRNRNAPLCRINCALLRQKGMSWLMTGESSPLADTGGTIHFINIGALSDEDFQLLFLTLRDTRFHKRNKLIFSCSLKDKEGLPPRYQLLLSWFGGMTLTLPPLREHREDIPHLASLYISTLNMRNAREVAGIEPEALEMLKSYDWPASYDQFKRVLGELVVTSEESYITAEAVSQCLAREMKLLPTQHNESLSQMTRGRSLEEMEQMIVRQVLSEENGNQRATAARLGISRTTLWRMLQKTSAPPSAP